MVAFGGDDLATLFLTTSRKYLPLLPEAERDRENRIAGGVFSWQSDVRGIAEPWLGFT